MRIRRAVVVWMLAIPIWMYRTANCEAAVPIDIGDRLELFVDDYLIDSLTGRAVLQLHPPVERDIVIAHDKPWEGNTCAYHTVFKDGDLYRMYYRGSHNNEFGNGNVKAHPSYTCYAESRDGIHWTKPNLKLYEFDGSKNNNIVFKDGYGNFAPFKDENPDASPDAKYKAIAGFKAIPGVRSGGLYAYKSPDGLHWDKVSDDLIITEGRFDSLNLAFYDTNRKCYVSYVRDFRNGLRDIKFCVSEDFVHWTDPDWIEYQSALKHHLYTNAITQYVRAPHLLIGLPKRYISNRNPSGHPAKGISDAVFMTSHDGRTFQLWSEAIIRPGPQESRWVNRNNMPAWGLVETDSGVPGTPNQLSMYATEDYYSGDAVKLRRYTWRLDGFASINAPYEGGQVVTKPIVFALGNPDDSSVSGSGRTRLTLLLNVSTSAAGSVRVELQNENGRPIPGFTLAECKEIVGDSIDWPVAWKGGSDVSSLAGTAIRMKLDLKDADVYALQFRH